MNKSQIISWLITIGAAINTLSGVIMENAGLLSQIGIPAQYTQIIMFIGLVYAAFSKSIKPSTFADDIGGVPGKNPPPKNPPTP